MTTTTRSAPPSTGSSSTLSWTSCGPRWVSVDGTVRRAPQPRRPGSTCRATSGGRSRPWPPWSPTSAPTSRCRLRHRAPLLVLSRAGRRPHLGRPRRLTEPVPRPRRPSARLRSWRPSCGVRSWRRSTTRWSRSGSLPRCSDRRSTCSPSSPVAGGRSSWRSAPAGSRSRWRPAGSRCTASSCRPPMVERAAGQARRRRHPGDDRRHGHDARRGRRSRSSTWSSTRSERDDPGRAGRRRSPTPRPTSHRAACFVVEIGDPGRARHRPATSVGSSTLADGTARRRHLRRRRRPGDVVAPLGRGRRPRSSTTPRRTATCGRPSST